ncbi:MAG: cytochrome c3 family protein [Sulfuricella sp.]
MALKWLWFGAAMLLSFTLLWAAEPPTKKAVARDEQLFNRIEEIPNLLAAGKTTPERIPDPHWREDACQACHKGKPTAHNTALRGKNINQLCFNCHAPNSAKNHIHAVDMKPSAEKQNRMPEAFAQALKRGGGVITCIACHELPMQCKKERFAERKLNPMFFRGGPFQYRTDLCFNCHDPSQYERLNPHDQITDEGTLNKDACLPCHLDSPNRFQVKSIADASFNVIDDLTQLCTGCHPWIPHPPGISSSGPNHLTKPTPEIASFMKETEKKYGVELPLDPTNGQVFCATCHNPHERGVLQRSAGSGADTKSRLRRSSDKMCPSCHNK